MRKLITISFSEKQFEHLQKVLEKTGKMQSEFIRQAVDDAINELTKHDSIQKGPAPSRIAKQERDTYFEQILSLTPGTMTTELFKIGYFDAEDGKEYWIDEDATTKELRVFRIDRGLTTSEPLHLHYAAIQRQVKKYHDDHAKNN